MKTFSNIVIAGALLASMSFAQHGDPFREERFKAKFGRYSQAEEARQNAINGKAVSEKKCADHECWRHQHTATGNVGVNSLFQAKLGHPVNNQPRPRVQANTTTPKNEVASNQSQAFLNAWSQAKFGRVIRRAESPSGAQASPTISAVAVAEHCDRPRCCD
jgi:hypothetical protein